MPNVQTPLKGPLRSWEGIRRDPHADGNLISERALIRRRWESAPIRRMRSHLDATEPTSRPFKYPRSMLFGFALATLLLGRHVRDAHRRIQSDPELRSLFGAPPLTPETERRLGRAAKREDVPEDGFPSRTMLSEFIHKWLPRHPELLDLLEEETYERIPREAIVTLGIKTNRVAFDGTKLQSPHKGKRGQRTDPGARFMGRDGERGDNQRWKMTLLNLDLPLVVGSLVARPSAEISLAVHEVVPAFKERSDRIRAWAAAHGKAIPAFHRAAVGGDGAFGKDPMYEALYDHDLYGVFEPPDFPDRVIEGTKQLKYENRLGDTVDVIVDACNDGTHFCECQADRNEKDRVPMRQRPGRFGKRGEVYIWCDNLGCDHAGFEMYVPYRKHDAIRAGDRREAGEVDYKRVNPLWRGDEKVVALNFLCRQAIEHYHQQRFEMFRLGSKDRRSGRRFLGDDANRFWHVLGDLLWNLTVIENHAEVEPVESDPAIVYANMLANKNAIDVHQETRRQTAAARAEAARKKRGRRGRFKRPSRSPTPVAVPA